MAQENIQKIIAAYFAALRRMDMDAWLETFAKDAVSHDPVDAPPIKGHEALRLFFQTITAAFDNISFTEDSVFVAGSGAAVKWTGRGVGKNGRAVNFEGIDVFEVNSEGKIQTVWAYWNPTGLMAALQG